MNNKVLVELIVPELDERYDLYIPINRKIGNIIELLNKSLSDITHGEYEGNIHQNLYNRYNNSRYNNNSLVYETDIRNGSCLILL